jgi:hypothetical protein
MEDFIEMAEIVESAFVGNGGNAQVFFGQKLGGVYHTIFVYKAGEGFFGYFFKITAE